LYIRDSIDISNLDALANLTSVGGNLQISGNSNVSCEGVALLLGWPSGPPDDSVDGAITISNNATGCNSVEEVLASVSGPTQPTITSTDYEDGTIRLTVSVADDSGASITEYSATCTDGTNSFSNTSPTPTIEVTGLTNGTAYVCTASANKAFGTSGASAATASITPEELSTGLPIWLLKAAIDGN
jgi:hypothetical protein